MIRRFLAWRVQGGLQFRRKEPSALLDVSGFSYKSVSIPPMTNKPPIDGGQFKNWAGNVVFGASRKAQPGTLTDVQELVASSERIRAVGTAHSFSSIADTTGVHISLANLDPDLHISPDRSFVTVGAGIKYGELAILLHGAGLALHNMASLPHISVGGAIATGTHGSGDLNGNLATAVVSLQIVTANGRVVDLTAENNGDAFNGAVVSLGALGIVTRVGLRVQPAYSVSQVVFAGMDCNTLCSNFEEIFSSSYSVSAFTKWQDGPDCQLFLKRRNETNERWVVQELLGARRRQIRVHPLPEHSADCCTEQCGIPGPWHERLPHFRLDFTPSFGDELQTEYLVPRSSAVKALWRVKALRDTIGPFLQVSEIRTIAADDLWLSGSYGRDSVGIHFTWHNDSAILGVLPFLDAALYSLGARPHWGKLFTLDPTQIAKMYPQFAAFTEMVRLWDPKGKFSNSVLGVIFDRK